MEFPSLQDNLLSGPGIVQLLMMLLQPPARHSHVSGILVSAMLTRQA